MNNEHSNIILSNFKWNSWKCLNFLVKTVAFAQSYGIILVIIDIAMDNTVT